MSTKNEANVLQMIRAPFLSSIISPLLAGTFLSAHIQETFSIEGFLLVLIMGLGLHAATNTYNDIYDTLQGTDRVNRNRNEFSGGSGILIQFPHLKNQMFRVARYSLLIALAATIFLMFVIKRELWLHLWLLYLLSAFFSKYYTAVPFKLAGRGWGEVSVWFAFGPMAILIAAVSQNVGLHPHIIMLMPVTGISTLSILLIGQLIDKPADEQTGKHGVAVRAGGRFTAWLYITVQLFLIINIVTAAYFMQSGGRWLLLSVLPYLIILPAIIPDLLQHHYNPGQLKSIAKKNVQLHLLFSLLLSAGLLIRFLR
ncbi:MAG: hypothetical protein GF313_00305 [Caldithrix sp.]|nr:hypothetical protein [Caldithrix sp.]